MYYFGARYYDADVGRWLSFDPKMEFFDAYRYTTNPMAFIDPTGLAEVYILASLGLASTTEVREIEANLTLLYDRFKESGYSDNDVKLKLVSSFDDFKTAVNDPDAKQLFYKA